MFIHLDSTAVHVCEVRNEFKPEYYLLKAKGKFLNFASELIAIYFDVYIPTSKPNWSATSTFVVDDILKLAGTKFEDNTITVCTN